jgi:PAS domain S-box-containing protein
LEDALIADKPTYEKLKHRVKELEKEPTESKRPEEVLMKSEERFRIVFNNAPQGIALADHSGRFLKVNSAWENMFGYNEEESQQLTIQDITPAEDIKISTEKLADLFRGDIGFYRFEKRFKRKDGSIFWGDLSVSLIHDLENGFKIALGVVVDITDRKRFEEALRDSEEFSFNLLKNSPHPILVINKDTTIRYVNPALERLTGFSSEELIDRKAPYPWWTEETMQKITEDFKKGMSNGAQKVEELFQKKDGERFWVEITSVPIRKNEAFKYYLANWVDITDRKQAESALIGRGKELEDKTNELEEVNAALKVLLKHRDKDQQDFEEKIVANVKELILPYVEQLNNSRLNSRQAVYLNIVKSNLEDIITPFLHQLSSKYFNLTPKEIQIAGLVKDGKTTKEIAELLNSSTGTVEFHRNNLRKKLGLRNTKTNLRSFLLALQ